MGTHVAATPDELLADFVTQFYSDPLGFVIGCYPWSEPGPLKDYDGPDEWQRAFLADVGRAVARNRFDGVHAVQPIRRAVSSGHGVGKEGPYSLTLHTPTGIRRWGDLMPGDLVFAADGSWTKIVARHEQGIKPIYRVTFDDGSSTLCGLEHLWTVRGRKERRRKLSTWRTITTEEILRLGVRRPNGKMTARQWEIPRQGAARWVAPELPVPPYLMGLWLGDGAKGQPGWCKPYAEVVERVRHKGYLVTERKDGQTKYLPGMMSEFRSLPVFTCGSHKRYIPEVYKYSDVEQRRELLRGLLDTDGECGQKGSIGYSTTSRTLAEDVVWLVRSLGGKAKMQRSIKDPFYYDKDRRKVPGRLCYRLTATFEWNPFTVKHKADRWHKPEERYLTRWIDAIEYSHDEPAMCITVDRDDGLYLANDFIVTHNSTLAAWLVDWIMSTRPYAQGTVTANTYVQLETKTWAAVKRWTGLCLTGHWFVVGDHRMYHRDHKDSWFCSPQSCKDENSEAFAGQHAATSTSFYVFDEACFDEKTEALTQRGWLQFADITPDDRLLTPEGWQRPLALHVWQRQGTMLEVNKRGLSLSVTPRHELYGDSAKGVRKKVRAEAVTELLAPRTVLWSAPEWPVSDDELRLAAWYYSEGHLIRNGYRYKCNGTGRPRTVGEWHGFGISNNRDQGISELLDRLGLRWRKDRNRWLVYDKARAEVFAAQGIGCLNKTLPPWMLRLSRRQLRVFLSTYVLGDGYVKKNASVIYTSSRPLADMLHAMAVLAGYNSSLTRRSIAGQRKWIGDHWATSTTDGYVVYLSTTGARVKITGTLLRRVEYRGMVYCATVQAGLLLTRRNGTVIWSGNSGVPDKIHEVAEGGLTDGEPMIFLFGNCTRATGHFHRACFGAERQRWSPVVVDSRHSKFTNKEQIKEWVELYGEDSDFLRVRVRGVPPRASDAQFIDHERVSLAQKRQVVVLPDEPLVAGCDMAWGGSDDNVIRFRRGADARSIRPIRVKGEFTRDPQVMVTRLADILSQEWNGQRVHTLFLDSAGIAGPVGARLRALGHRNVQEVNFGADSPDEKARYYRDYMWANMKAWLLTGAIDSDPQLEADLLGPGTRPDQRQRIWLESKEDMKRRGVDSPDDGDALCFVGPTLIATPDGQRRIDELRVGDLVLTPMGKTAVEVIHESETDHLTTVSFSNGSALCGKGSHEAFTFTRGNQRLDALTLTDEVDILTPWRRMLWRLVSVSFTQAESFGFKQAAATFRVGSRQTRSAYFIAGCIQTLTAPFRTIPTFITEMAIGGTTPWKTSKPYRAAPTGASTCAEGFWCPGIWRPIEPISSRHGLRQQRGTGPRKEGSGTGRMASPHGLVANLNGRDALDAGDATGPISPQGLDSVLVHADKQSVTGATLRTLGRVCSAVRDSWRIVIGRRRVAPVAAQTVSVPPTRVYNLTLREHNAYYANRVLVFNCLTFAASVKPAAKKGRVAPESQQWSWT